MPFPAQAEAGESAAPSPVCSPWCAPGDVPAALLEKLGDDAAELLDATIPVASEILFALSGRRWRGAGCERTVHVTPDPARSARIGGRRLCVVSRLELPDYPVTAVLAVLDEDAVAVPESRWRLVAGRYLERLDGDGQRAAWPAATFEVTYTHGSPPPLGGVAACASYAAQLALARKGDKTCALPSRVQSVTRQNVSFVLLDTFEFLEKGRLGLPDVDAWIASVNPTGATRRSTVFSPDIDRTRTEFR